MRRRAPIYNQRIKGRERDAPRRRKYKYIAKVKVDPIAQRGTKKDKGQCVGAISSGMCGDGGDRGWGKAR
jgi:hypothetical protein